MTPAVAYLRVSTEDKQARFGRSLKESQPRVIQRLAKTLDLEIVKEFEDTMSGKTNDRPGLQAMLNYLDESEVKVVVLAESDRVTRSPSAAGRAELLDYFTDRGITVYATDLNFDPNNPGDILLMEIRMAVSADEWRKIRRRTLEAVESRVNAGVWAATAVPFGYQRVEATKEEKAEKKIPFFLEAGPESEHLRGMFRDYAGGKTLTDIAKGLNGKGLTGRDGHAFNTSSVRSILRNRVYCGMMRRKVGEHYVIKETVNVEPLISAAEWNECNNLLDRVKRMGSRSIGSERLYAGLLYCGSCGDKCWAVGRDYYRCRTAKDMALDGCDEPNIREKSLERPIQNFLGTLMEKLPQAPAAKPNRELLVAKGSLEELNRRYYIANDGMTYEEYLPLAVQLRERIEALEKAQPRIVADVVANPRHLADALVEFGLARPALRKLLNKIYVSKSMIVGIELADGELIKRGNWPGPKRRVD